jgi:CubicO group peptidase (beta-lactamase class C family)
MTPHDEAALTTLLRTGVGRCGVAGASLALVDGDGRAVEVVAGLADATTAVMIAPDTVFQIGSTTKPMTATMALQLVDEGRLTLETPLGSVLPAALIGAWADDPGLTLGTLLSHRSGLAGDVFTDGPVPGLDPWPALEAASRLGRVHAPGEDLSYCNIGFVALGAVVEALDGVPWAKALQARIATPCGLASLAGDPAIQSGPMARGHVGPSGAWRLEHPQFLALSNAAAGTTATASAMDLARFGQCLLDARAGRHAVLPPSLALAMAQPAWPTRPGSAANGFGLGLMVFDWSGGAVIGHDGLTMGQQAFLRMFPETGVSVALLANGGGASGALKALAHEVFTALAPWTGAAPPRLSKPVALAESRPPATILGLYARSNASIRVAQEGGRATFTMIHHEPWAVASTGETEGPFPLVQSEGDIWLVMRPGAIWHQPVWFAPDGHQLSMGHRRYNRQVRP